MPRQRTTRNIEVLKHLLHRCEALRRFPAGIRRYAGKKLIEIGSSFDFSPNT